MNKYLTKLTEKDAGYSDLWMGVGPDLRYTLYMELLKYADTNGLLRLTNHPNGSVRTHVTLGLIDKHYSKVDSIFYNYLLLRDTITYYFESCTSDDNWSTSLALFYMVDPEHPFGWWDTTLYRAALRTFDSVVLYTDKSRLARPAHYYLTKALPRVNAYGPFYNAVKKMVLEDRNFLALTELAKYRKEEDIELLKQMGDTAYLAISHFPHPDFWPILKSKIRDNYYPELIHAIAAYKNDEALRILEELYARFDTLDNYRYMYALHTAVATHLCPAYSNLLLKIWEDHQMITLETVDYLSRVAPEDAERSFVKGLDRYSFGENPGGMEPHETYFITFIGKIENMYRYDVSRELCSENDLFSYKRASILKLMLEHIGSLNKNALSRICSEKLTSANGETKPALISNIRKYGLKGYDDVLFRMLKDINSYGIWEPAYVYRDIVHILYKSDNDDIIEQTTNYLSGEYSSWKYYDDHDKGMHKLFTQHGGELPSTDK